MGYRSHGCMIVDNRSFTPAQKLPCAYFFEGLVRQCLLNYLKANSLSLGGSMSSRYSHLVPTCAPDDFRAYGVSPEGPERAAVLPGHHLLFNKKSTDDKSGKANVAAHVGSDVWGVLYTISDADLDKLDKGRADNRRVRLSVTPAGQDQHRCLVYIAKNRTTIPYCVPTPGTSDFLSKVRASILSGRVHRRTGEHRRRAGCQRSERPGEARFGMSGRGINNFSRA